MLLIRSQEGREFHAVCNDEVTSLIRLLAQRHAEAGIAVRAARLGRTGLFNVDLLAVNGGYSAFPACESFFEIEI